MEYTRSKGEHSYETFEGTPEEIAKLIKAIDKNDMRNPISPTPIFPDLGIGSLLNNPMASIHKQ